MAIVRTHDAPLDCIGTSAMRRGSDADDFAAAVAERTGLLPRVLSGDEEAMYSFLGATANLDGDTPVAVLDVGGGSTELAVDSPSRARHTGRVARTRSIEVGAVRLADRHPALLGATALDDAERTDLDARARADAASVLAPLAGEPRFATLIAVGGTVFTAAVMISQSDRRDGVTISREERAALIDALLERGLDARKAMPNIRPQRADILPAGLIVVDEACRLLDIDEIRISEDDILAGYLASNAFRAAAAPR